MSSAVRSSKPTPRGVERLYPPGLLEAEFERRYAVEGIPLNDETIEGINASARRLGIKEKFFS